MIRVGTNLMPRPGRITFEGGLFHVFNRLGRGDHAFSDEEHASLFVDLLREVVLRDGLTVYAWCLMSNHFHLAVRTGVISLDRPMASLQQRMTKQINARRRVFGPLWQGRYKAKLVQDQQYLDQLLIYIHLNPVSAGIVGDPAEHPWSGHLELLGDSKTPIVDIDEVLRVFGTTRRSARSAYVQRLKGVLDEEWVGEQPGRLPWWRLGRPPKAEDEDPETVIRERRKREILGPDWRPTFQADEFVVQGSSALGINLERLRTRGRSQETIRVRELLMVLGVERYRLKVKDLAVALNRSSDGMTKALARGIEKRRANKSFLRDLDELDHALSEGKE